MRNIGIIIAASIKNNIRSKSVTVVFIAITLMIAAALVIIFSIVGIGPVIKSPEPDRRILESYLGLITYTSCIVGLGINLNVFAFQSLVKEKSRGNLASLLAAPISVKDIWLAKSLAVFIPGLIMGILIGLTALFSVNYIYFVPKLGFIFTLWIAINCFLAAPVMYFSLTLLAHFIGLTGNSATANIIAQIALPVILNLMIQITIRNVVDAASWSFALVNFGIAAIIAIVLVFLRHSLKTERIILSR